MANWGWRMIFAALMPILLFSLLCGSYSLRQSSALQKSAFPLKDYLLLAAAFVCFILASSLAGSSGWLDAKVILLFTGSLLLLAGFCRSSLQAYHPLIHLQVFWRAGLFLRQCDGGGAVSQIMTMLGRVQQLSLTYSPQRFFS